MALEIEGLQHEIANLRHRISGEDCLPSVETTCRIYQHMDSALEMMGRALAIVARQAATPVSEAP